MFVYMFPFDEYVKWIAKHEKVMSVISSPLKVEKQTIPQHHTHRKVESQIEMIYLSHQAAPGVAENQQTRIL